MAQQIASIKSTKIKPKITSNSPREDCVINSPRKDRVINSPRKDRVTKLAEELKDDAKRNAKHIVYQSFGSDKNKTRKNSKACDRGTSSGPARYCSSHIRQIYPQEILGDNNKTEWCVEGRHNKQCCTFNNNNPCRLCNINSNNYRKLPMINFAEALRTELGVVINHNDPERYKRALQSFLTSHIINGYPGTNKENTILRIKVNDTIWMQYFIKLTAFSSLLKTSAPSGYKYQDRISIGRKIKIQNNINRDLIFCVEKDASYNDPEKEEQRPVVNCVGFWNLLKDPKQDEIRNIIHLNVDQGVNVCFGFLMKNNHNVNKIEVELECTRQGLGLKEKPITLWCWPSNADDDNSMSSVDVNEHKSNISGSPTISTQSVSCPARSISPITGYNDYPSFDPLNALPTIAAIQNVSPNHSIPTTPVLPPQINCAYSNNHPQAIVNKNVSSSAQQSVVNYQPQSMMTIPTNCSQPVQVQQPYVQQVISHSPQQVTAAQAQYIYRQQVVPVQPHVINNYNCNSAPFYQTHYGAHHTANYNDHRYSPYRRPTPQTQQRQTSITHSNNNISHIMDNMMDFPPQTNEYSNNNDEYLAMDMEQDQFVNELNNDDNFPLFQDNETSSVMMLALDNQSMFLFES